MSIDELHRAAVPEQSYYQVKISQVVDYRKTVSDVANRSVAAVADSGGGAQTDSDGQRIAPQLAAAIAISRANGTLTGPITAAFLKRYSGVGGFQTGSIQKTLAYLDGTNGVRPATPDRLLSYFA